MTQDGRTALVLEGGGFRGIFTAGTLDVLQEKGLYGFGSVWGVSAGAINATSFKSRQIGRSMRIMLAFRDDRRFMSFMSLATTGDIAGAEFMYDEVQNRLDPCDNDTFNANPLRMYAVASDVERGMAAYLPVSSLPDDVIRVRASASLPLLSRVVEIDGRPYLDGGTTNSIPFDVALGLDDAVRVRGYEPAERAVVVLTRDRPYVREKSRSLEELSLALRRYDRYPEYRQALETRAERYNAQRELLWELERAGRVIVLCPPRPVEIGATGNSGGKLLDLYLQGRQAAMDKLDQLQAWVG